MGTTVGDVKAALQKVLPTLPHQMGVLAIEFTMQRFRNQDWVDYSTHPWKRRKSKKNDNGRALLMLKGVLRNSIHIVSESPQQTVIGTDVPYAKVHNEGSNEEVLVRHHLREVKKPGVVSLTKSGKPSKKKPKPIIERVEVKAHLRKMNMPKRQFMGESPVLNNQIQRNIAATILKALKN